MQSAFGVTIQVFKYNSSTPNFSFVEIGRKYLTKVQHVLAKLCMRKVAEEIQWLQLVSESVLCQICDITHFL